MNPKAVGLCVLLVAGGGDLVKDRIISFSPANVPVAERGHEGGPDQSRCVLRDATVTVGFHGDVTWRIGSRAMPRLHIPIPKGAIGGIEIESVKCAQIGRDPLLLVNMSFVDVNGDLGGGQVIRLDSAKGRIAWWVEMPGGVSGVRATETAFHIAAFGQVAKIDARTGLVLWMTGTESIGAHWFGDPTLSRGIVRVCGKREGPCVEIGDESGRLIVDKSRPSKP